MEEKKRFGCCLNDECMLLSGCSQGKKIVDACVCEREKQGKCYGKIEKGDV